MRAAGRIAMMCAAVLCSAAAVAQPVTDPGTPVTRAGIFWHYNVNQQRVDFQSLPGVPGCCQQYEEAIGTGFTAGALLDIRLDRDWSLGLRGSYGTHDATITDTENLTVPIDGEPVDAEIEHAIDATLSSIDFDAILGYRLVGGLNAHLGFRLGVYMNAEYFQNESLVRPYRIGTFENGRRVRNEYAGELPRLKNVLGSILMGISYHLTMNERNTVFLVPELQYLLNVTPVVQDIDWYADGIHIGLALKFSLGRGSSLPDKPGRDEYEDWKKRQMRTEPQPNTLRNPDDARVPKGELRENPPPMGDAPSMERYGRNYGDDEDEQGTPLATPPEQAKPEEAPPGIQQNDLRPIPTDADIPRQHTRKVEKIQTAAPVKGIPLEELAVAAYGVDANGNEAEIETIRAEEYGMTDVITLLNYVFFPENSADIPDRYTLMNPGESELFSISNLDAGDKLRIHYNVLNILGTRLQEFPDAAITIVGCNSGNGQEEGRLDLSRARAESVRDYLANVWGVDSKRMTIVSRTLPENPSTGGERTAEENRRVEVYSDTWEILRPIVWSGTEWKSDPPAMQFEIPVVDEDEVERWSFSVTQDNDVLKEYSGGHVMPEVLEWDIEREQPFRAGIEAPVEYTLRLTTPGDDVYTSEQRRILVSLTSAQEKRIAGLADTEFTRYHLIVFESDDTQGEDYKAQVTDMVSSIFGTEATITVAGPDGETSTAGVPMRMGMNDMPINTNLPEGRFYSRAIRVLVAVPAER